MYRLLWFSGQQEVLRSWETMSYIELTGEIMSDTVPFNPFAPNAMEEYLKRKKISDMRRKQKEEQRIQREKLAYLLFDESGIRKFDYYWANYPILGNKIRPVVIFDKKKEHVFCAPISSSSEGEIRIPAVTSDRTYSWIHLNFSEWISITDLINKQKGVLQCIGRLPIELAESLILADAIMKIKTENSN